MKAKLQVLFYGLMLSLLIGCSSPKASGPPAAWSGLNGGMTRQEISAIIGPPQSGSGPTRDVWRKSSWELQVDYDQNGRARNIVQHPAGK